MNSRAGLTLAIPVGQQNSVKLAWSKGVSARFRRRSGNLLAERYLWFTESIGRDRLASPVCVPPSFDRHIRRKSCGHEISDCWRLRLQSLALGRSGGARQGGAAGDHGPEGLVLQKSTKTRIVLPEAGRNVHAIQPRSDPGTRWSNRKGRQKDYNNSRRGLEGRVSDKDIERMKAGLAAEFKKVFTKELQDKGGYQVVTTAAPTCSSCDRRC